MKTHAYLAIALTMLSANYVAAQGGDSAETTDGGFGRAAVLAFSSDSALTIQHSSQNVTTIQLAPSVDYFVIDNLSLGGFISFDYSKSGAGDGSRVGVGPRVGYNIKLSDLISIWPKAGFAYAYSSSSVRAEVREGQAIETSRGGSAFAMNLFAPIMVHPARHFFGGFGPFLDVDLSGDDRVTMFGAKLTLGGWID